jgi:general secretion pathway protein G
MISRSKRRHRELGSTLAETLVITTCFAISAGSAVPNLANRVEQIPIEQATQDIACEEAAIVRSRGVHRSLPAPLDPWGNAYEYLGFTSRSMIEQRTYHELPINSDYDLYSKGRDGRRDSMLNFELGRDDIARARDGELIGPASDFRTPLTRRR